MFLTGGQGQEKQGKHFNFTYEAHSAAGLGEVWEEDEFWIELSWRVDPDGTLGIRQYFESPYQSGQKLTVAEYCVYAILRGRTKSARLAT